MNKKAKPADGKNDRNYQKNPGQKTPSRSMNPPSSTM